MSDYMSKSDRDSVTEWVREWMKEWDWQRISVCVQDINWFSDWLIGAWVIKGIKGLNKWLSDEWVNERKWVSEWIVFLKRTNERLFSYIFVSKETPKHGSSSTRWLEAKVKPLVTLNK